MKKRQLLIFSSFFFQIYLDLKKQQFSYKLDFYNIRISNMQSQQSSRTPPLYLIQTGLKVAFIFMSLFNLNYTLIVAFLASLLGLIRVCKMPQFSKEYLTKAIMNNHGQNILYISIGCMGFVNYLYYAPIVLFFAFNIVEFIKIKFPTSNFNAMYGDLIRTYKFYVYEGKCRIEMAFLAYCVVTLPLDFLGRAIKIFIMAQMFLVKYRINNEFRFACVSINQWIQQKTSSIGFINNGYKKIIGYVYEYANRDPRGAQPQQAQQ